MTSTFALLSPGAMLILNVEDQFARDRGIAGPYPRLLGRVRFLLTAYNDQSTGHSVRLKAPLEMKVIPNPSGFYLFFGSVVVADGSARKMGAQGWPWTIRVVSDYYQTMEQTPAEVPTSFIPGTPGEGASRPITFELTPGPNYPFPHEAAGRNLGRLRGVLRNPDGSAVAGVRIDALDCNGHPQFNPAFSGDDGQWVLVIPALPAAGSLNIRFTFADGTTKDVAEVPVAADRENSLPQTVLRGQVRLRNVGVRGAAVRVDKVKGAQTSTDTAGHWSLYFDVLQGGGKVEVTAMLPDQNATKSSQAVIQPRATVLVPSIDF